MKYTVQLDAENLEKVVRDYLLDTMLLCDDYEVISALDTCIEYFSPPYEEITITDITIEEDYGYKDSLYADITLEYDMENFSGRY